MGRRLSAYGNRIVPLVTQPADNRMPSIVTHSALLVLFFFTFDAASIALAALGASYRTLPPAAEGGLWNSLLLHLPYLVVFLAVWFFAALRLELFASHRKDGLLFQIVTILKGMIVTLILSGFIMAFTTPLGARPVFLGCFGLFSLILVGLARTGIAIGLWTVRQWGYNPRHILLVGANLRTKHLVDIVARHGRFGYHIVGILEDDPARLKLLKEFNLPHLGRFEALETVLEQQIVDEVHIGLPVRSCYELIQSMAHLCIGIGVSVRLIADLFPLRLATSRVFRLGDIPMLSLSTVPESALPLAVKRVFDIVVAATALVALLPVFVVLAILIRLDSAGPVFFLQERVGLNQRRFRMYKFRSMVANAEALREQYEHLNEADGPVFKIRDDPRITRVGKFIRKYSIDELPQFINVVQGDMSLVGPRPLPTNEAERFTWDQRRRLSVKPGMTGLWQVSGRSDLSFKQWVDLDLAYIDSWSIAEDVRILMKTVRAVIHGRGAA